MAIEFGCPACKAVLRVPDDAANQKGRCPNCRQKIRVPQIPREAAAPAPKMAIEFSCPRCQAVIRSPAEAAGQKGQCPQCHGRIRVPEALAAQPSRAMPAVQEGTYFGLNALAAAASESDSFDFGIRVDSDTPRARKTSVGVGSILLVVIPSVLLLAIVAAGAWILLNRELDLGSKLTAVELKARTLAPMALAPDVFAGYAKPIRALRKCLENEPIRIASSVLEMEIRTKEADLVASLSAGEEMSLYRVDTRSEPKLTDYLNEHGDELDAPRETLLQNTAREFLETVAQRCYRESASNQEFIKYRNPIGFYGSVKALGYHVHATVGSEAYPCVREGAGLLYFVLPKGVKTFQIVSRDPEGTEVRFPGKYTMHVVPEAAKAPKKAN